MIDIKNEQDKLTYTKQMDTIIRNVIITSFKCENVAECGVSVLITDNERIRELNREYRGKDAVTDVLSFPLNDEFGEEMGDIVINLERAVSQAEEFGHGIDREIAFLTAHSMLHLMGYDHQESETEMFEKQEKILKILEIYK